ncbi:glycosyltransferase [Geoanaerobacter pelophilus]|uniref:Glycosyltransferase n=1 Tax=Geoanaerobacter pelophilus TaxID=60036 RepID=A0ABQ0MHV9_9BACT|nr:glycosyltransferase family 2 protein [Geoanaerobacter pelophilus]GAW66664.1 glycosyltransferase [Geoanaerobacter pelophilus]
MPRICVITVVRDGAQFLEGTIQSVLEQKERVDLDYIVIDGGSTDGSVDIIRRYSERLLYWVSEPDRGVYDAMNKGWAAAGDDSSILFLGAGDRIVSLPDHLERFGDKVVVYGMVRMGEDRVFHPRCDFHLKLYNSLHHQALLVPKALHPAPPFDLRYRVYADFDFNQRLANSSARFVYSPQLIGYARPGGVSDRAGFVETLRIVYRNSGFLWAALAVSGYYAMKIFPLMKRLRPIRGI